MSVGTVVLAPGVGPVGPVLAPFLAADVALLLEGSHLSKAIHRLLTDRSLTERAARIGDTLRTENGTSKACDAIEAVL